MSKVNLEPKQFGDFTVAFFLDKFLHPELVVPYDDEFNKLAEDMERRGMKSLFLQYYLKMDPNVRLYYKRIKPSLEVYNRTTGVINIMPFLEKEEDKKEVEKKPGLLKRAIKKLLNLESITEQERQLITEEILLEDEDYEYNREDG